MGVRIHKMIFIDMSADEWELFSDMPGADSVARELSINLQTLLNESGLTPGDIEHRMEALMDKWSEFGAADSEPLWHMRNIIAKFFRIGD